MNEDANTAWTALGGLAVNLGDDADSTGAPCGQFAGAIYI
jgi:ADP-ribosylglycohydrolase